LRVRAAGAWQSAVGQPSDTTLTALAGLATGADQLPFFTGLDTASQTPFPAYARTLLAAANADAARTTLGATATGAAVFTAADQAAGRTTLGVVPATDTVQGLIELATGAEAAAGTDALRAITPAGLRSGLNAAGTAPIFACRAWVNFNGIGTVAIRGSGNVSSIARVGVGIYQVSFAVPMPDALYCAVASTRFMTTWVNAAFQVHSQLATSYIINTIEGSTTIDHDNVNTCVFR